MQALALASKDMSKMQCPRLMALAAAPDSTRFMVFGGQSASLRAIALTEGFDVQSRRWEPLPPMPTARSHCTAAVLDGVIYVLGGLGGKLTDPSPPPLLAACERFHPTSRVWERLPCMGTPRRSCGAVPAMGALYAVGGMIQDSAKGTFTLAPCPTESLCPETLSWKPVPKMIVMQGECIAAPVGGKIYAAARIMQAHALWMCIRFDPVADRLERVPPMGTQIARHALAGVEVAGKFCVVGDSGGLLGCFDPAKGAWEVLRPKLGLGPVFFECPAAAAADGRLFVLGGRVLKSTEEGGTAASSLQFGNSSWEPLPPLPIPRAHTAVTTVTVSNMPQAVTSA